MSIAILEAVNTTAVQFHGQPIITAMVAGVAYVAMKPIVENLGMSWSTQMRKLLNQKEKYGYAHMNIPSNGGLQQMLCLPLKKLNGWLFSINPEKVRADIRDRLIAYQEECFSVLHDYWTKGQVTNPRKAKKAAAGKITSDQQEAIKQLVLNRGHALPKEKQAKAIITMWSSLKSHFGCSYKDINEGQFTEALSLASRVPLDGEYLENKRYTINLTGDELCSIAWLYKAAKHMREDIEIVGDALSKLKSPFGPSLETMAREYRRTLDNSWKILNRETQGLDDKEMASQNCSLNWERVLPDLKTH